MSDIKAQAFEILDCTIRDGGYLNNWDFDRKIVKELCRNLSRTGVDIIEIGFRNKPKPGTGLWYSVPEDVINDLFKDVSGIKVSLMVDCDKCDLSLIPQSEHSPVNMYRVACHKDRILEAIDICREIKKRGYDVSIQLMGIAGYTEEDFSFIMKPISEAPIDYLYFADSYGSLFPRDIKKYTEKLRPLNKKIGFHAHNSLQLAFANTLEALNCGVNIVDATVCGMGRGSGNLPMEVLIIYLEKTLSHKKYNSMPILDLIDRYFIGLKNKLNWGYSLPYMLSGIFEVHPSYAKQLVDYHEYNIDDMIKVFEVVKELAPVGFKKDIMDKIISSGFVSSFGKSKDSSQNKKDDLRIHPPAYKERHTGRDFLILANGPSLKEHKKEIDEFIERYNPVVMGANYLGGLFKPHYHAFSNKKRFINYIEHVDTNSKLLISSTFEDDFIKDYANREYESIAHFSGTSEDFRIEDGVISSNCRTVSILLMAVAIVMGAKRIFIAGMDGYKSKEHFLSKNVHFYKESEEADNFKLLIEKHNWNEKLLSQINSFLIENSKEGLHIITPSSHSYFYSSIYNWIKQYDKV